jgi:hypothetical protein
MTKREYLNLQQIHSMITVSNQNITGRQSENEHNYVMVVVEWLSGKISWTLFDVAKQELSKISQNFRKIKKISGKIIFPPRTYDALAWKA